MAPDKIAIALTNHRTLGNTGETTGFWLSEMTHPYFAFLRAGRRVDLISPKGGAAPIDPRSRDLSDAENREFLENHRLVAALDATLPASALDARDYNAIFFAGGHGTMWDLPDSAALAALARDIYERGGAVGAVCHGPAALVNLTLSNGRYLVNGKIVSAFTNEEETAVGLSEVVPFLLETKLIERGARFDKAPPWQPKAVVSERLVTGQNPASAKATGLELLGVLDRPARESRTQEPRIHPAAHRQQSD